MEKLLNAKKVNLQEWEPFGGGGFGTSYYNKMDDSVILKLNKPSVSEDAARKEFLRSKAVYDMGIPSAEPLEYVTDGQRYGMIVERIQGKESFGRIIADHPERLEELAGITADYTKALHGMPCDTEVFDSVPLRTRSLIAASKDIPDHIKTRLLGYIDGLEPVTTCLHGDINPCNIIIAQGKIYWIDLGDFGYGDPLMDFCILAHMHHLGPNPVLRNLFHMDRKALKRFYEAMGRQYFGPRWSTPDENIKFSYHINVTSITDNEIQTVTNNETFVNGQTHKITKDLKERKVRVTHDYSEDIIGTWEGKLTSEQDAYSDGQMHRWEYKADGTFVYYRQNDKGEWIDDVNTMAEFFVDGTLLCMRWKNVGDDTEKRESWEIASIENGKMKWTALRQSADGSTYTTTFEMTRVNP